MDGLRYAVIGAGPGGQSMAAVLSAKGRHVSLMDRDEAVVESIRRRGEITLTGKLALSARPELVTCDAHEAVAGADVIMVVTTADAHEAVAASIAGAVRNGQVIILNPGMFCGSLAFRRALGRAGCREEVLIAETGDLMYTCRKAPDGTIYHSGLKQKMALAALPASRTGEVLALLRADFPILTAADSILYTAVSAVGLVLHCLPMLMNVNRMDAGEKFDYYMEGITPSVARMCEAVDRERVALAAALGYEVPSAMESLKRTYGLEGDDLYTVIHNNPAYVGIPSPSGLGHRFCAEDTFGSLVPCASLARALGVAAPAMEAAVRCIGMATGIDYAAIGRTVERMGLEGMSAADILALVR